MNNDYLRISIHQLVEAQVRETPDEIAVIFGEEQLTYRELNEQANQRANHLRQLGVGPDVLVGVCLERSTEMIVAILAILKAGGAYVPLDPGYPSERLTYMMEDSHGKILLTQGSLGSSFSVGKAKVIDLDQEQARFNSLAKDNLPNLVKPHHLAYVIYTSGSTGKPKGVAMSHQPLVNLLSWQVQNFRTPKARTLQFTPISFDVSFQEIFSTLAEGGTLVLISETTRRNFEQLYCYINDQAVERLFLPFVALQHLAEVAIANPADSSSLREVITAGEQLQITRSICSWFSQLKNCTLCNQYGPAESHVVTNYTLTGSPENWPQLPPVGRPIPNTQIYILNPMQRRKVDPIEVLPEGESGELAIAGIAVGRGYLNQPELTDSKFVPNPFSDEPGAKLYKTGDIARYLPDGNLEFIGRIDDQVKIRGVRVEVGEIEVTLNQHPSVKQVAVVAREDLPGEKRLVAYVVTDHSIGAPNSTDLVRALRVFLKDKLPGCLIPSIFVSVDKIPMTPSGKADRRALPAPINLPIRDQSVFPLDRIPNSDKTMELLSNIWSNVLGVTTIGRDDNFFDLGGNSLLAIQLISKVKEALKFDLPIVTIFEAPTIDTFSNAIKKTLNSSLTVQLDKMSIAELESEASLSPEINYNGIRLNANRNCKNIFITGVTGFLGAFLLYELLEQTESTIFCLVRGNSLENGKLKIQNNLASYLLWNDSYETRIKPIIGDLSKPLLGLTPHLFHQLAEQVEVIYHNGASINLIYPYSALREANVSGTQEILKLATQTVLKPIHFISTLDVFQTSGAFSEYWITESDPLNPAHAIHFDGYTKSKWVSEKMLTLARSKGIPVAIYRPAMITGHSKTGVANVKDLMNRLIKGFVQLGSAPNFEMMMNIAPADYFSQGVVYLSRQPESLGKAFNFVNPNPVSLQQFVDTINACGYPVKLVGHAKWEQLLIENLGFIDGIVPVLTSKPFAGNLSYLERCSVAAHLVSQENVSNGLAESSICCPSIDKFLLDKYFTYFAQSGFIPKSLYTPMPVSI